MLAAQSLGFTDSFGKYELGCRVNPDLEYGHTWSLTQLSHVQPCIWFDLLCTWRLLSFARIMKGTELEQSVPEGLVVNSVRHEDKHRRLSSSG